MIDREARDNLAESLRALAGGLITNDEYEDRYIFSKDKGVREVFSAGWSLYGDHKEYKLTGKNKLSKETKNEVARCILFLKSNLEYQWPHVPLKTRFIYAITFSVFGTNTQKQWKKVGDVSIWPFIKQSQLKHAKQRHGYLGISNT